jgi:hypothetical protein
VDDDAGFGAPARCFAKNAATAAAVFLSFIASVTGNWMMLLMAFASNPKPRPKFFLLRPPL